MMAPLAGATSTHCPLAMLRRDFRHADSHTPAAVDGILVTLTCGDRKFFADSAITAHIIQSVERWPEGFESVCLSGSYCRGRRPPAIALFQCRCVTLANRSPQKFDGRLQSAQKPDKRPLAALYMPRILRALESELPQGPQTLVYVSRIFLIRTAESFGLEAIPCRPVKTSR